MAMSVSARAPRSYEVACCGSKIETVVTSDSVVVSSWILYMMRRYRHQNDALVVGLDIEWLPNLQPGSDNPVATLQLCVGLHCLIIQILHAAEEGLLPQNLFSFLADPCHIFVGVGIHDDAKKLRKDCDLAVRRMIDLRDLAAARLNDPNLKKVGLKKLANRVLRMEMEKPLQVTLSDWDCKQLSWEQVRYACIDAFVSFSIARKLGAAPRALPLLRLAPPCFVATTSHPVPVRVCVPVRVPVPAS